MRIAGLIKNDLVDGLGFSVSLWTQGCPFHCEGCHNPETWSFTGGQDVATDGLIQDISNAIVANGLQRNFSVLGGEPLCEENVNDVDVVVSHIRAKFPDIIIVVWTGYMWEELIAREDLTTNSLLNNIDVLIDGQFDIHQRDVTLWLRGSRNQRVIDVQKSLREGAVYAYHNPYN